MTARTWLSSRGDTEVTGHLTGLGLGLGGSRVPGRGEERSEGRERRDTRLVPGGLVLRVAAVPPRGSRTRLVAPSWRGPTQGLSHVQAEVEGP